MRRNSRAGIPSQQTLGVFLFDAEHVFLFDADYHTIVVCVGISCAVPCNPPQTTRQIISNVLMTGVPFVVWIRTESNAISSAADIVREIVTIDNPRDLHLQIWRIRNGSCPLKGANPDNIGLLYDNPDRLPPTDDPTNPCYAPGRGRP
jgi:hypothetical protein